MAAGFFRELKQQIVILNQIIRTREFWIYFAVILVFVAIAVAVAALVIFIVWVVPKLKSLKKV